MPRPRLMTPSERLQRMHALAQQTQSMLLRRAFARTLLFTGLVLLIRLVFGYNQQQSFGRYAAGVLVLTPFVFVVFYLFNLLERYFIKRKLGDA